MSDDWQPIETAPRDGSIIIVWPPSCPGATSCARWVEDALKVRPRPHFARLDTPTPSRDHGLPPTHWRPVLAGPKSC
jgi:hypothetical protein